MAKRPNDSDDDNNNTSADDAPGATAFVRLDSPAPSDDAAGATAFVRVDKGGALPPPPRRANPGNTAPKKGLQVRLPDDEPPPPPPPKPKIAPEAPKGKGRRGAWWDEKSASSGDDEESTEPAAPEEAPEETPAEAPPDDAPGSTAFLNVAEAPPPPKRRAPERRPEPAEEAPPADDGRTQFFKPDQVVLDADVRERPAPQAPPEASIPWKPLVLVLVAAFIVSAISLVLIYRKDLFRSTHKRPSIQATDTGE